MTFVDLPEYTLVGNPLYYPSVDNSGDPVLRFEKAPGGLWVAAPPGGFSLPDTISFISRSFFRAEKARRASSYMGSLGTNDNMASVSILGIAKLSWGYASFPSVNELVERGLLAKSSYDNYFAERGLDSFAEAARSIHSDYRGMHYVTPEGHKRVRIEKKFGDPKPAREGPPAFSFDPVFRPA